MACYIFDQIAQVASPLQSLLKLLREELYLAIYADLYAEDNREHQDQPYYSAVPYYESIRRLRDDKDRLARHVNLLQGQVDNHQEMMEKVNKQLHSLRLAESR